MSFLACMTSIFHARQFYINSEHIWHILKAKKFNWFFTPFSPFFSTRPTSESYNDPLKVLTEGSMVEYLPVGSQEDPQTIIDKKNFDPWNPKSQSQPSVQWDFSFKTLISKKEEWCCTVDPTSRRQVEQAPPLVLTNRLRHPHLRSSSQTSSIQARMSHSKVTSKAPSD